MTFALRGIVVSSSVFLLVYLGFSIAVCLSWRWFCEHVQHHPVRHTADALFALRVFPWCGAAVVTAVFTVPSFLLLEPRSIDEPIAIVPAVLGGCGLALTLWGATNAARAVVRASTKISEWTGDAEIVEDSAIPVLRISRAMPALTATGILNPRVLISGAAEFLLTEKERQSALRHELAHVRRRDNLKKLLLHFVPFPGMDRLEHAWLEATELAADDAAVSSTAEALDLAAAIIKLSRLAMPSAAGELTTALVQSSGKGINTRVERLIDWSEQRRVPLTPRSTWLVAAAGAATVATCAVTYSALLLHVHTATEWLVK